MSPTARFPPTIIVCCCRCGCCRCVRAYANERAARPSTSPPSRQLPDTGNGRDKARSHPVTYLRAIRLSNTMHPPPSPYARIFVVPKTVHASTWCATRTGFPPQKMRLRYFHAPNRRVHGGGGPCFFFYKRYTHAHTQAHTHPDACHTPSHRLFSRSLNRCTLNPRLPMKLRAHVTDSF